MLRTARRPLFYHFKQLQDILLPSQSHLAYGYRNIAAYKHWLDEINVVLVNLHMNICLFSGYADVENSNKPTFYHPIVFDRMITVTLLLTNIPMTAKMLFCSFDDFVCEELLVFRICSHFKQQQDI